MLRLALPCLFLGLSMACGWSSDTEAPADRPAKAKARAKGAKPARTVSRYDAPNILVIVWDTVRADRMGVYGYDKPTTPRIDAWAEASGVVYERAVSPGVWTLPSHASLFTALPVRAHGVTADTKYLEPRFVTVAEALGDIGYDTWSFCANPYLSEETNILQGFDTVEHPWDPPWRDAVSAHMDAKLHPEDASTPVSPKWSGRGGAGQNKYLFKEAGPVAADAFVAWQRSRSDPDRPFLAFINLMEAHLPRIPSMDARRQVMTEEEIQRGWTIPETTTTFHEYMVGVREFDAQDLAAISGIYDASLIDLDAATDRLLSVLDTLDLADDTIVVLTSDHGESLGEHGLLLHKYTVYNTLSRVPLIVSWPGHLEPGREDAPKSVSDVLADVVALGRIPVDKPIAKGLAARQTLLSEGVVVEFNAVAQGSLDRMAKLHPSVELDRFRRTFQAMELGRHKVVSASDGGVELYDVVADPGETRDLSASAPDETARLAAALESWKDVVSGYEPTEGVQPRGALDAERAEALEALGYVE